MPCKTLLSLALLVAAGVTQAETLDRVEVMGKKVRTDVTRTCPSINDSLMAALAPAMHRTQRSGSYTVVFQLDGQRVGDVQSTARVADEYRTPLRRAVLGLDCSDDAARTQPQRFGFIVDVLMREPAGGGAPRMALGVRPLE